MAKKDDYLIGYETGIKKAKTNEPGLPDRYYKSKLDKVLAAGDRFNIFENPEVKDFRLQREADDKYLDSSMGKGEAQGRAEYDKAITFIKKTLDSIYWFELSEYSYKRRSKLYACKNR